MVRGTPTPFGVNLNGLGIVLTNLELLERSVSTEEEWAVGTPVPHGLYLEVGTAKMQPYPWLGPAVRDVLKNEAPGIFEQSDDADEAIEKVAKAVEKQAKTNVMAGEAGGRSPGTHPDHPERQTRELHDSIEAEKR